MLPFRRTLFVFALMLSLAVAIRCVSRTRLAHDASLSRPSQPGLTIRHDEQAESISIFRSGETRPLVTQNAPAAARPYLHPIAAPDGNGVLTEYSPSHHKHQTGLFWGFTNVNGRDYFHNVGAEYWRRVSATVLQPTGDEVRWQTVYDLLDGAGNPVLTETARWSMRERNGRFELDLTWRGDARTDVTIGRYDYGGLFLRMPWREGSNAEVVNAARQRNDRAEGQRAMWIDVGMQVEGRDDLAHIALFDHPANTGYPQAWRVDDQLGVGSARTRTSELTIGRNQTEVFRHRFVVYTGTLNDIDMTAAWKEFTGNSTTTVLWDIAQREGREAKFLTAEQSVAAMTTIDGFVVNAWAAEPMVAQPMAFCWDDRGRLWVAENLDYESRVKGFSNAGNSRIVILEDTNQDGVADSRIVFLEGVPFPTAIAVGFDGLFLGAPPNVLFVPDRNGDDKADLADIEVRLTGWGIQDRHETLNSLHWGPDGWLYGLQGYATSSKIRKPQGKGRIYKAGEPFPADILSGDGVDINGGVWRYHPTKDVFEVVAHGFSNPWGIDYDAKGQLLITACVIPHLWHVVPGGIYQRQGGQHFNPYVYGDIQTIADHRHRSAHGGARVYMSDAFPASQVGRIFMANIHEHAVLSDVLERNGSSFTAHHGDDFLLANNAQWLGFSLEIGPDGALYVLDWHDGDICGMDVLHHETGRIYRIAPSRSLAQEWTGRYSDLRKMRNAELVDLQTSKSDWHARRARIILQHRAATKRLDPDTHDRLRRIFDNDPNPDWRLRAMWALHVTGGWTPDALADVLDDKDEYVRAWAIQLLCEDGSPSPTVLATFTRMAKDDRSPVVRLYLASALQRLDDSARWSIAAALIGHGEDMGDPNLPKLIWLGVEPLVAKNPALALEHASNSSLPLVAQFVARRTVDADALEPLVAAIAKEPRTQLSLLEGMRDGLEGRIDLTAPSEWHRAYGRLKRSDSAVARVAQEVAGQFGDTEAARYNLATLRSRTESVDARRRALQSLTAQRRRPLIAELPPLLDEPALRVDAIRSIAAFDSERLGKVLIEKYPRVSASEKTETIQTLASRRSYGQLLTEAIQQDIVPRRDIPTHVARQLLRVVGSGFTDVWGPVERGATDERVYSRYRALLNDSLMMGRANAQNGRALFLRTCGACHKMYGEGGAIGPDLTGSNRANVDYLLSNVLEPNAEVPDSYKMVVVTTRDGRNFSGNMIAETDRQLTLRIVGRDPVVINKSEIQSREATAVSMMPPRLFDTLTESEVVDLVGYLRTVQPIKEQ
jgi:putative membrane-bound dehydrogenase-like protein